MGQIKIKRIQNLKELILFEDEEIILVNKPRYMASLDDKTAMNLNSLAKSYDPELSLCHRLDKNTSAFCSWQMGQKIIDKFPCSFSRER